MELITLSFPALISRSRMPFSCSSVSTLCMMATYGAEHTAIFSAVFYEALCQAHIVDLGGGLAIVRRIVERHHGTITARSKPGEGATFIITLPFQQVEESIESEPVDV